MEVDCLKAWNDLIKLQNLTLGLLAFLVFNESKRLLKVKKKIKARQMSLLNQLNLFKRLIHWVNTWQEKAFILKMISYQSQKDKHSEIKSLVMKHNEIATLELVSLKKKL